MHPTCYCYWLANSFSQFLPQDACASVDVLSLFDNLNCIALLYWLVWLHLPYRLQWVLVIAILSTSLSACVVIVLLNCTDLYSCLVLFNCIVYLHIPSVYSEYRFISLFLTHMSACDCISLAGRTISLYCYCVLLVMSLHINIDIYCWYFVCFHNYWGQSPLPPPL